MKKLVAKVMDFLDMCKCFVKKKSRKVLFLEKCLKYECLLGFCEKKCLT